MPAASCAKVGEWKTALDLLSQLRAGIPSTDKGKVLTADAVSFNAAINALGRGGQWEMALSLLREMKDTGGRLEVGDDAIPRFLMEAMPDENVRRFHW